MKWTIKILALSLLAACGGGGGDDAEGCTDGEIFCDGDFLVECVDGEEVETDCAVDGMMCHEEMGHCMDATGAM